MENRELSDAVCVVLSEGLVALIWLLWTPCIFKIIQILRSSKTLLIFYLRPCILYLWTRTLTIIFKMH